MSAWPRAGLVAALVLAADQATKALIRHAYAVGEDHGLLTRVANKGVAFSAFEDQVAVVIVVIALAIVALLVYFARNSAKPLVWLPTGLLAGGAAGNVLDRLAEGAVTDFIKLPAWPAFNVADVAITLGVVALVLVLERDAPDRSG